MKLFVWNRVDYATGNYHSEGGIVAIAENIDRARELIGAGTADTKTPCDALEKEPDITRDCAGPEYLAIHPDAGCC